MILFIAVCGEAGVHASTDCERWVAAYKEQLAHTKAVRRMQAAHARMKRLAQRKLATYVKKPRPSAPKVLPARYVKPKPHYTKEQMLERFTLLCGDLPTENAPTVTKLIEGKVTPEDFAPEPTPWDPMEFASTEGEELIPDEDLPPDTPYGGGSGGSGGGGGGGFSGPPIFGGGGHTGGGGTGDTPTTTTTTVIATVPEPGSVLLLLTGVAGAAGAVRRRRRA